MRFDWGRYLTLAQELVDLSPKHANKEALLRCAISRSYYAAFCKTRNYLRDIEKDENLNSSPSAYQLVIDRFRYSDNTTRQEIGDLLIRLRKIRNVADYQDRFYDLEATALQSLNYSEEVIDYLNTLRF